MKHAAFKASYADWKLVKTRACVQIIFEVPVEKANEAYDVLGGMPVAATESWFAIARLNESAVVADAPAVNLSPSHAPAAGVATKRNPLTLRSVLLSRDPLFIQFLDNTVRDPMFIQFLDNTVGGQTVSNSAQAAEYIRQWCKVESRKDILPGTEAATRLDLLESAFVCWRDADKFVEPS